jgi:hypothetical protein
MYNAFIFIKHNCYMFRSYNLDIFRELKVWSTCMLHMSRKTNSV